MCNSALSEGLRQTDAVHWRHIQVSVLDSRMHSLTFDSLLYLLSIFTSSFLINVGPAIGVILQVVNKVPHFLDWGYCTPTVQNIGVCR